MLISRHLLQMFLIQLIHRRLCVTFNSVKVCHCFFPADTTSLSLSPRTKYFPQSIVYYFLILTPIVFDEPRTRTRTHVKIFRAKFHRFCWRVFLFGDVMGALDTDTAQYSPGAVRRNWHNWLITPSPGPQETQTGEAGTCQRMQSWAEPRSIDVALDFNAVVCL